MIKNIEESKLLIFDLGNVIVDINMQDTICAFEKLGVRGIEKHVTQSHSIGGFFTQFEQGFITPEEFCDSLRKLTKIEASNSEIYLAWNAMIGKMPSERIKLIEKLKEKHTVVLLSNTNQIHLEYFDGMADGYRSLSDLFDKTWYSHQMHLSKPCADIYKIVLEYHNVEAKESAFFDDSQANIDAANELGIHSYIVNRDKDGIMKYFK